MVSSCLGFEATRYDGSMLDNAFVRILRERKEVEFIPVCPEVGIGLGVPRDTLRIILKDGEQHLVQPKTGRDFSKSMIEFTERLTKDLIVDGFIFKADSPSVGTNNVKVYSSSKSKFAKRGGPGFFSRLIMQKYPNFPIESDRRLRNVNVERAFLKKVYVIAHFREHVLEKSPMDLISFHKKNYFLIHSHNPPLFKELDDMVKFPEKINKNIVDGYFRHLCEILNYGGGRIPIKKTFQLMFNELKKNLTLIEERIFQEKLVLFEKNQIYDDVLLSLLEYWSIKFGNKFMKNQSIYHPFPSNILKLDDPYDRRFLQNKFL